MRFRIVVAFLATCLLAAVASAQTTAPLPGGLAVWTLPGLERALRDTPPGATRKAVLEAARNEWESFQIAVRAASPTRILALVPGELRLAGGSAVIAPDRFRLHREHQLHLTVPTYRNQNFRPGWYPDALIPFRHPLTREPLQGARFQAIPFDLPAEETHAFWIDLHVPPDAAPGRYDGVLTIRLEGAGPAPVPVALEVWDFALPQRPSMSSEFGSPAERLPRYYRDLVKKGVISKEPDYAAIEEQCARLMQEHRLDAPPPNRLLAHDVQPDGAFTLSDERIQGLRRWGETYHISGIPLPRPQSKFKDPAAEREKIARWCRSWEKALEAAGLGDRVAYVYLLDEPNDEKAYDEVRRWGKAVREAGSRVKILVTEQTAPQEDGKWGDLYGAVDIWVPLFSLFDPETARKRQALGEQIWTYTALCQRDPTPWWHTDFPLAHYRVPAWIAWRHDMKGLLYWGGLTHWSHVEDPWTDPLTYQPGDRTRPIEKRAVYNGEGLLAYPARDAGFDGIVASMRLKALRDGLEDFDYFALRPPESREQVFALMDPVATSWYKWSNDPEQYYEARRKIAERIVTAEKLKK